MGLIEKSTMRVQELVKLSSYHPVISKEQVIKIKKSIREKGWNNSESYFMMLEESQKLINGTHRQQALKELFESEEIRGDTKILVFNINEQEFKDRFNSRENPNRLLKEIMDYMNDHPISYEVAFFKLRMRKIIGLPPLPRTSVYLSYDVRTLYPEIAILSNKYNEFYKQFMGKNCGRPLEVAMALYNCNVYGKKVAELGGRNSFLSPFISNLVESIIVSDNFKSWKEFGGKEVWFKKWKEAAKDPNKLKVEYQDITSLHYEDNSFDLVFAMSVIEHAYTYPDSDTDCAKEMARVVKPGGMIILSSDFGPEFNDNPLFRNYRDEDFIERIVEPSGLIIDSDRDLWYKGYDPRGWDSGMVFLTKPTET